MFTATQIRQLLLASTIAIASALAACGGEVATSCVNGSTQACTCPWGAPGAQTCSGGNFGMCLCGDPNNGGTAGFAGVGGTGGVSGFSGTGGVGGVSGTGGVGGVSGTGGTGGDSGVGGSAGTGGIGGDSGVGGSGGVGGVGGVGGSGGTGGSVSGPEPRIPTVTATCPTLRTGNISVLGQNVQLWVGTRREDRKGSVMFYWHGTGSNSGEAVGGLGAALTEITNDGGIVASFTTTTGMGQNTANNVWFTGDFAMADIILKCATEQLNIDTRRVYTGGCSAGGLQAGSMLYGRSSYIAAAMPNSGGTIQFFRPALENPAHVPALITAHGSRTADVVGVNFADTSMQTCMDVAAKGGFAVNCDHGGGHCGSPSALKTAQWEFLKAHPFGVDPSPYESALPSTFPSYCTIIR